MPLLIKNGQITTVTDQYVADILAEGETITAIGRNLTAPAGAEVIDATGKLVFPGFIDPHVHIYLPFMGTYSKDTYDSASRAALVGGTTTLIEMCCPSRTDEPLATYELWLSKAAGISACDYSFHMGVARYDESMEQQMREIVRRGIASFKVFLAYKGAFGIDDNELYRTLKLAKELGVIVTAHCENAELVAEEQARLIVEGKTGPEWHEKSRPVRVEAEGVHHLTTFAEMLGTHVYIVHTSNDDAIQTAVAARRRGVHVWIETVAPYLVLDASYAEKPNFEGAKFVMSPPLRAVAAPGCDLERARLADHQHDCHRPRAVRFQRSKGNGSWRLYQDSQWHPQHRGPRQPRLHLWRETRAHRPQHVCRRLQHPGSKALRTIPAQGHDRDRFRRRPRRV